MNDHEEYADEEREYPTRAEEKADEIALDMQDEERRAAEKADVPDSEDDWDDEDDDGSDEWQPGECDHCHGQTVDSPFGPIFCACAIGQGASPEDCVCGPEGGDEA